MIGPQAIIYFQPIHVVVLQRRRTLLPKQQCKSPRRNPENTQTTKNTKNTHNTEKTILTMHTPSNLPYVIIRVQTKPIQYYLEDDPTRPIGRSHSL